MTERPAPAAVSAIIAELFRVPELDPSTPPFPRPGETVGRFTVLRELGRGGFGRVFEARDGALRRNVALKIIRRLGREGGEAVEALLRREAEAAKLSHPNIVTIHDTGRCPAGSYLVLELLRGESLEARLARGPLPVRAAVGVALDVVRAVAHAHAAGVLHRDLKPANVFLVEGGPAKVLDFGLAAVFGAGRRPVSGTPGYMAPEQEAGGHEDERTDLFAVGLLLHEMLAGTGPSSAGSSRPSLDRPGVPAPLAALVARACAQAPAERHRDAAELLETLLELERGWAAPAPARASAPTSRVSSASATRRWARTAARSCARPWPSTRGWRWRTTSWPSGCAGSAASGPSRRERCRRRCAMPTGPPSGSARSSRPSRPTWAAGTRRRWPSTAGWSRPGRTRCGPGTRPATSCATATSWRRRSPGSSRS
jgi:serine/threonine protein kinase